MEKRFDKMDYLLMCFCLVDCVYCCIFGKCFLLVFGIEIVCVVCSVVWYVVEYSWVVFDEVFDV